MAVVAAMNSAFDYFSPLPVQNSISKSIENEVSPVNTLRADAPFEFVVQGSEAEGHYLDLANSEFHFRVQVLTSADAAPAANAEVSCIQNLAHSMFQRIEVFANDRIICDPHGLYPYAAYFADLLCRSKNAKDYWMGKQGWWGDDDAGKLNVVRTDAQAATNSGIKLRHSKIGLGQQVTLIMTPHLEIFNSDKFIPPGVKVKVRFTPATSAFVLTRGAGNDNAKFLILDAKFYCQMIRATPSQDLALVEAVRELGPFHINLNRVTMKTLTVATGSQSASFDNIFEGPVPNRIIIGMVADTSFTGAYGENPFHFQHFGVNHLNLVVNGTLYPPTPYTPNMTATNPVGGEVYIREYNGLLQAFNRHRSEEAVAIKPEQYIGGYTLFAFDLTPDRNSDKSHSPQGTGNVRLILKFAAGVAAAVTIIVHGEFDSWIEIDANKRVTASF